jgi:hypothetical protein
VRSIGGARSLVNQTPGMAPQCWAAREYRREFSNGLHRLFQSRPYMTCKSSLDTSAVQQRSANAGRLLVTDVTTDRSLRPSQSAFVPLWGWGVRSQSI